LFCVSCHGQEAATIDRGWRNYGPAMLYKYMTSFLLRMQSFINESADSDSRSSDIGDAPYSLNEFHRLFAEEYGSVITDGDVTQKAVVYHTTPSKRTRNVGWYHVFEYNSNPIDTRPDPEQNSPALARSTTRDDFWCGICTAVGDSVSICIGHVLVGKLVLTHFPDILGSSKLLGIENIRSLHGMKISKEHKMEVLFPDFDRFKDFVKNCLKKTLKWNKHPFAIGFSDAARQKLLCQYELCSNFEIENSDGSLDPALQQSIATALSQRNLESILSTGLRGMNSDYIDFLLELRVYYDQQYLALCANDENLSSQKATILLRNNWMKADFFLPFLPG